MADLASLKQEIVKYEVEVAMLESLLQKLEIITSGPSLRKLGREVENITADLRILLKDINNTLQKAQIAV